MKYLRRTLILGAILTAASTAFSAPKVIDKIAAIVNDSVVLESDISEMMQSIKNQEPREVQQLPDNKTLRYQVIERLVMDNILLQMAKQAGIQVTDDRLNEAIANIATKNKMSIDQLRSRLAYDGMNYATYREQVRKEMLTSEVRNNEVRRRVMILPQEVERMVTQIESKNSVGTELNISHILLPLPKNPTQQQVDNQENLAKKLASEARHGASFSKLAITYSADPQALQGGNIGWGHIEELPSLFAEKLVTARKNDIVGPIRSGVGFHILKVNDVRDDNKSISVTEVHARHILLKTSPIMSDDQARQKLEEVATQINRGKLSFADAAKHLSQDSDSANQGGDLGWASLEVFDPVFRYALMHLKKGQMSGPIRSSLGWHLVELMHIRQADKTDTAKKESAYRLLFNRKFSEEAQTWMQEQRASAYVKILDAND